jgi:spore maturation protein CgeB
LRILLCNPGSPHSTADVEAGLRAGLEAAGVEIIEYHLAGRLSFCKSFLEAAWRGKRKTEPAIPKPNVADVIYHAGVGALERALRFKVDAVLVVSAILLHPDVIVLLKRAGLPVAVLFTESPYDLEPELQIANLVDCCWTNERTCLPAFQAACPRANYLPAAWHPARHGIAAPDASVPAHDVIFVGSGFPSRIDWLTAMDWTGIDLGLYGTWATVTKARRHPLKPFVKSWTIDNRQAVALYRRAKIGLNLYRGGVVASAGKVLPSAGESLNPRALELAACGIFHLSEARTELPERFGTLVPTFSTPAEASALVHQWFGAPVARATVAAALPACVAGHSWNERAAVVAQDLEALLSRRRAPSPNRLSLERIA